MSSTTGPSIITDATSISAFNRGPIPTQFSAPTSCLSTLTSVNGAGGLYFGHNGDEYFDTACFPTPTLTTSSVQWNLYYYSPVISCPSGWYTAAVATSSFGGLSDTYLSIGSATTAALCCPSGYTALNYDHQCDSQFPLGTNTILYKNPSSAINGDWVVPTTVDTALYVAATASATSYWTVFGDGIPIWFEARDLSTATQTSTPTPTTSPISSTTSATSTGSSGLTTGAKAGIGIGVSLGVVTIAALIGWFLFRRKRRYDAVNRGTPVRELESIGSEKRNSELPAQDVSRPVVHELYSDEGVPVQQRVLHDNGPSEVAGS
ncbi:uncharacterized protein LY89DRAFT_736507 [Mollisia scopiformis]|uniref:Uncharacterized protein n=1 Tax=Mollisia scopiformis TaxID=149040 RepID=A0A194X2S2_MOLSC|nr:uncharacterized protein LY89DRAFT_736507 [Mollisia scopiformis]KUJ14473.1 hypothetical protein LY89DRAFT_736507 [Mollisia scopiformis]